MKKFIIKKIYTSTIMTTLDYDLIITDDDGKEILHTSEEKFPKGNFMFNLWGDEIIENEKGYKIDVNNDHRLWGVNIN